MLSEVQAICDRVGILRQGNLKAVEQISDLTRADFRWVTLELRERNGLETKLAALEGVSNVTAENNTVKLRLTGDFDPLLRALQASYVVDLRVHEPTLEEIFLAFYGGNHREG